MSFQDPIADCLTRIRNGLMRGKVDVDVPYSKLKHELVNVLVTEGYIKSCSKDEIDGKPSLKVVLKYHNSSPVIKTLKRISKPSLRKYSASSELKSVKNGLGSYIVSTSCLTPADIRCGLPLVPNIQISLFALVHLPIPINGFRLL